MNKKTIVTTVIIVVIAIAGFFLFTNKAEAPEGQLPVNTSESAFPVNTSENALPVNTSDNTPPKTDTVVIESENDSSVSQEDVSILPDEQTPSVTTVTYTDNGFSPETITISKGDTVRFVNESSGRMWTASSIHPTHSLYPEESNDDCLGSSFDQCRASVNGESWEFTFNEVGQWRYHNHIRASKRGTVTVEEL